MNSLLPGAIALVALLYSSVGHAGATGYVAVMSLFGLPAATIRPTALALNVLVALIATVQFARAGHFDRALFWPLARASVPCALVGGALTLPTAAFELVLGGVLLASAARLCLDVRDGARRPPSATADPPGSGLPSRLALTGLGGGIGMLSGLTGVGGGVFLTPALLALSAVPVKRIAAVTAPFILVNSLAGLGGGFLAGRPLPAAGLELAGAALLGAALGAHAGAFRLPAKAMRLLMAGVLVVASVKLLTQAWWPGA